GFARPGPLQRADGEAGATGEIRGGVEEHGEVVLGGGIVAPPERLGAAPIASRRVLRIRLEPAVPGLDPVAVDLLARPRDQGASRDVNLLVVGRQLVPRLLEGRSTGPVEPPAAVAAGPEAVTEDLAPGVPILLERLGGESGVPER